MLRFNRHCFYLLLINENNGPISLYHRPTIADELIGKLGQGIYGGGQTCKEVAFLVVAKYPKNTEVHSNESPDWCVSQRHKLQSMPEECSEHFGVGHSEREVILITLATSSGANGIVNMRCRVATN